MAERKRDLGSEIEELFDELWQIPRFAGLRRGFKPHVDCFRTGEPPELTVVADLAGVDPDSVNVVVGERTLTISGKRVRSCSEEAGHVSYQQMEIPCGPFERRINLGEDVDPSGTRADYQRGLLRIVLPIAVGRPRAQPVSIEVTRR